MEHKRTANDANPKPDATTEALVHGFLDLISERKCAGKTELAATYPTIATWLRERTGLNVLPRHVQVLVQIMQETGLLTIGGGGIGLPNTYDTTEAAMGTDAFWSQVEALLLVWKHPSRRAMESGSAG